MEALPKGLEEWGLVGGIVVVCFALLRQLILWMQKRIDAKDELLAEQYAKALEVSSSVISLASETGQKTTAALDALTAGIVDMRREICVRLDKMEGGGGKG